MIDTELWSLTISDLIELDQVVDKLLPVLKPGTIVELEGELGAGKTTFVSHLGLRLGASQVSSPTYSLIQCYKTNLCPIQHVDLYRLETPDEIESSGFWDLFHDQQQIIFVEWAQRISEDEWPLNWLRYRLKITKLVSDDSKVTKRQMTLIKRLYQK